MTVDRDLQVIQGDAAVLETHHTAALQAMHDARLGQPRAAAYDTGGRDPELWCWRHEQTVDQCRRNDDLCEGQAIIVHDPAGEAGTRAAMGQDRADTDKRRYQRAIEASARMLRLARNIQERYVAPRGVKIPSLDDTTLDTLWCRSCKRDGGYCETISKHYGGKHLCRFCGDFANTHGVQPPVELLRKRHAGDRIYDRDIQRALGRKAS